MLPPLLAKSRRSGRPDVTLQAHLADTERAAEVLFHPDRRLFRAFVRFFKLTPADASRLVLHLRVAALLHDIGKANADFYRAVTGEKRVQAVRHEHLSAILSFLPEIRQWLSRNRDLDLDVVTGAVLSHHLKASREDGEYQWCATLPDARVPLYLDHPEVASTLARISEIAALGPAPALTRMEWDGGSALWTKLQTVAMGAAGDFGRRIRKDPHRRGLLLAVKAGLIAADAVSSALVREGHTIEDWIEDTVHRPALSPDDISKSILSPRVELLKKKNANFQFHRFQDLAAEQGSRSLLLAACGVGKTLAAWRWAAAQAAQHEFGSVIFLYPTRGTATEGFRDYVGGAPEGEAALVHGTSRYELEGILANPPDLLKGKDPRLSEQDARLFALGLWSRRYFSATVDQFLGFLEHQYPSVCLLPLLADSAVIIDEVHAFDAKMFDALLAFLGAFDVPVLAMTATLTSSRRDNLERAGMSAFPKSEHRAELPDLEREERRPRYVVRYLDGTGADAYAFERAVIAYRAGARVLWVVNTVARAQWWAKKLHESLGTRPHVYHGRFRLMDRQNAHRGVIGAFQRGEAAIAVTTQVCEMSLDLDADILVTEVAVASSLIQRFGRANRHPKPDPSFRAELLVYRPQPPAPYTKIELDVAEQFIRSFHEQHVSQYAFAEALEQIRLREAPAQSAARFLDSGYFAVPGSFRDTDDYAGNCVLDVDLAAIEQQKKAHRPWDGWILSAPRSVIAQGPAWLPRHVGVTDASAYDDHFGLLAPTSNRSET